MPVQQARAAHGSVAELGLRVRLMAQGALTWFMAKRGDQMARMLCAPWRDDPYPLYAQLRAQGPVVRSGLGLLMTTTHTACEDVLRDHRFGVRTSDGRYGDPTAAAVDLQLSLLELDPPDHTRLRRLAAPAFRPRRMELLRKRVQQIADELLDEVAERGEFDLIRDFAAPLPIRVICELLALPPLDGERLAHHGTVLAGALDGVRSVRHLREMRRSFAELDELFTRLIEQRRAAPGEDVVSDLVAALDEEHITSAELIQLCDLLLVAGFETTVNLIGNATQALLRHRDQWLLLRDDPELAAAAVEETLRWDPPVQATLRIAHEPVDLLGHHLRADEPVIALLASAGRDPGHHSDPDTFDISRPRRADHLAFSSGIHHCLGAPLARLESETALQSLATRLPGLRQTRPAIPRRTAIIHGLRSLPTSP